MTWVGDVHDVQEKVRINRFHQSSTKRCDQVVGQMRDEAHSIRNHGRSAGGELQLPTGRIQSSKEAIFHQYTGISEAVKQGGFAGIGIAHQADLFAVFALFALCFLLLGNLIYGFAYLADLHPDEAFIDLNLFFAHAP